MTAQTIENPKPDQAEREYLCGLTPLAPVAFFEVPVSREREGSNKKIWRAIQFALQTTHYRNDMDINGYPRFGRVETLTGSDIEQIWEFVSHRVVRWIGKPRRGRAETHPEIEGQVRHGYGPNGAFTTGKILDKRDDRYVPNGNDEPLESYIVLRPLTAADRGVVDHKVPMTGGQEYFKDQLEAAMKAPVSSEQEIADRDQRILELEAMLRLERDKVKELEEAHEREAQDQRDEKKQRQRRR